MSEEVLKVYTDVLKEKGIYERMTEDRFEDGLEQGIEQGIQGSIQMLSELGLPKSQITEKIATAYHLTPEQATNYINRFSP